MDPTVFDPTTLVTFIFRTPPEVRTVELLGSWDNFNIPYRMHHDRRRGTGVWSGCFSFEGIVFDGWNMQWTTPRSGGLRQGGTYWYYYRLNYDFDSFDERQPQSTSCPLLPGQKVNVLDVPTELVEPISRCHSACADIIGNLANLGDQQTLNPQNRSAVPSPPPPSKMHARSLSDAALNGRLEGQPVIVVEKAASPASPSCSPRTKPVDIPRTKSAADEVPVSAVRLANLRTGIERENTKLDGSHSGEQSADESGVPDLSYSGILGAGRVVSAEDRRATSFASAGPVGNTVVGKDSSRDPVPIPVRPDIRSSVLSLSPPSIHNVQFYGSRPGTNLTEDPEQYRPRMYSLANLEIRDFADDSAPASPASFYSPQLEDVDEGLTPHDEKGDYDLVSPTFSVATISTGGHTTPFRLSAQNSLASGTYVPTGKDDHDIEDVANRLRALHNRDDHATAGTTTTTITTARSHPKLTSFVNYPLPTIASESSHSLSKPLTASAAIPPRSRSEIPPSPSIFSHGEGLSIADDIFAELGFLSGSIA